MTLQSGTAQTVGRPVDATAKRYGRYEVLKKLATGGMGEVYLARSVGAAGFRKHVVIKRILPHLVEHGHFVDALVREANILVMLDHPNIVQVFDLGMDGGDYFMTMEFVHGYNLATVAHYCAQKRLIIPAPACAAVTLGVLAALEYAHALRRPNGERHNVIHRDVSPQNVMISRDGRVKLTDFGIAKVLDEAEGEYTNSLKGKFRYMAPEALDGGRMDQRYDIFATGILLFEALCRRHLFGGRSDVDILKQVRIARVPEIERYHPGVPPALVTVTRKALAKDPAQRYQDAGAFAAALREAIRPVTESEAASQLRAFIADLYGRPDFPINKPKLPALQDLNVTRSIVLHSNLSEAEGRQEGAAPVTPAHSSVLAPSGRLALWLIGVVLVLLVAVVSYIAIRMANWEQSASPKIVRVIPHPAAGGSTLPPKHASGLLDGGPAVAGADAAGGAVRREPDSQVRRRVAIRFTPEIGRRYFGKQSGGVKRCVTRFAKPGEEIQLGVVSEILSSGRVSSVTLDPKDRSASPMGQCVIQVARSIRYPRHDKAVITYRQPVRLRAAE